MDQIIEHKSFGSLELSDMDKEHRTAVIAHAAYDNIDRAGDISRKGMFEKSWRETKASDIVFDIDHDKRQQPGKVIGTFESEAKAFTKVSFGTHTLGTDTMLMMDEGIIRGASFEFITEKKAQLNIKGRKIRELKEVKHLATTVTLSLPPVNPLAGVISVKKAIDVLAEYKSLVSRLDNFCRNTSASDECIIGVLSELKAAKQFITSLDTVLTQPITEPGASSEGSDSDAFHKRLLLFNLQLS